jgi:hypothetical protein
MSHASRRDFIFLFPFLFLMGLYALADGWPEPVRAVLVLAAIGVVAMHIATGDEVIRARAFQAGALAFSLIVLASMGIAFTGQPSWLAEHSGDAWAGLMAIYLVCWSLLRLLRG